MKVALVESKPSRTNFYEYFDRNFEFDSYALCSDPSIKKVYKKDVDIDMNVDDYDWVILVGSEALKYFTKETKVMTYTGKVVDNKFLPIINPAMLSFKPEAKTTWENSKKSIIDYISGDQTQSEVTEEIAFGIQDTTDANKFLRDAIKYDCEYFAIDSETTALYPRNGWVQGISISYNGKFGAYIDSNCFDETTEELLQELFDKKIAIFHNAKFDMSWFIYHFGLKIPRFEDTMLLHYLIDENPGGHGLKQLSLHYTPYGDYEKALSAWINQFCRDHGVKKADFNWGWIPFEVMYPYAAMDALCTFLIFEKFRKIKENPKLCWVYDNILIPGSRFLMEIENHGVPIDKDRLVFAQDLMQNDIDGSIAKLYEHAKIKEFEKYQGKTFNPNSVVQLRKLLFDFIGLKPTGIKTGTGQHSTAAEVLEILAEESEIPKLILNIRQKSKIKNTYLDKIAPELDKDGRLRTSFNLHTTSSGRLSSSGKMNMQQLPRDNPIVKGCIRAKPGNKIVAMDLGTAEMYVAAVLSEDKALQKVFLSGGDFHSTIAKQVFHLDCPVEDVKELYPFQRQAAKAVSFGILYGAGPHKIASEVNISLTEAADIITHYFRSFPKLKEWIENNEKFIKDNGFVYSHFGRKRRLPNVMSSDRGIAGHTMRSGLNFLVQSVASDINLLGAIDTSIEIKTRGMKAKIFALVHDSILAEVPEDEIEEYCKILLECVQKDRGVSIPGCPIGCDVDIHEDYSLGKFEKEYVYND